MTPTKQNPEVFGSAKKKVHLIILMFNCQIIYLSIPVQISFLELTEHQSTFAELKVLLAKMKMAILLFLSDGPTN